ncbi:MAG: N-acetylmuramoyl-L-alanine amidase [Pseudomonadota bacterium]
MGFSTRDIQARCAALGFNPGPVDGMRGPKTRAAMQAALTSRSGSDVADLFDESGLHRVHWHWTAGAYGVIEMERRAYNVLIDQDGNAYDGLFRPEMQAAYRPGRAASHTLNANSGAIGIGCDAMAGAHDRPFRWGAAPLTWAQIDGMLEVTRDFCRDFDIPVSPWSTLSHAEVQPNLGIRQRWKWDIRVLPDDLDISDARAVGDTLRARLVDRFGMAAAA